MAFHFSLAVVLRWQQSLERQKELLLREANQQVRALQLKIDSLNLQMTAGAEQEHRDLASTLSGAELIFLRHCRSALLAQRGALEKRLASVREIREFHAAGYRQARQRREVLETLCQQQRHAYHEHEARSNQRQLDDLLLLRRAYLRRP